MRKLSRYADAQAEKSQGTTEGPTQLTASESWHKINISLAKSSFECQGHGKSAMRILCVPQKRSELTGQLSDRLLVSSQSNIEVLESKSETSCMRSLTCPPGVKQTS